MITSDKTFKGLGRVADSLNCLCSQRVCVALIGLLTLLPTRLHSETSLLSDRLFGKSRTGKALENEEEIQIPPIALPKDEQHLYKAFTQRQTQWVETQLLLDFPKRNTDAPWLKDALEVMSGAAFNLAGGSENAVARVDFKAPTSLLEKAAAVKAAGCNDPLFNFIYAFLQVANNGPNKDRLAQAEERLPDLLKGADSPHIKLLAAAWIWWQHAESKQNRDGVKAKQMEAELPRLLSDALAAIASPEDNLGFYLLQNRKAFWQVDGEIQKYLWMHAEESQAEFAKPNVQAWLRDTMIGEQAVWAAWQARGNDSGIDVNDDQWKGFGEQLAVATRHLTEAWKANPDVPFAAERMIVVTMGGGGEAGMGLRDWFDRSTAACFDFWPAYLSMNWAYRPRWGGSHELMLAFAKAAVDTGRYDTYVPRCYIGVIEGIAQDIQDRSSLIADKVTWQQALKCMQGYMPYAKTETDKTWLLSWAIYDAVIAGDYPTAASYTKRLKERILPAVDNNLYELYGFRNFEWRGILAAQQNKDASKILDKAETAYWQSDLEGARSAYKLLTKIPEIGSDKDAKDLVQQRLAAIDVEQRLATGDWVKLSEWEHGTLWRNQDANRWNPLPGGILSYTASRDGASPSTYLTARIGLDFECRARLDDADNQQRAQFGCFIGCLPAHSNFANLVCGITAIKPEQQGAALVSLFNPTTAKNPPVPAELRRNSRVRILSQSGKVTFWIDDHEIFTRDLKSAYDDLGTAKHPKPQNGHFFGLGSYPYPKGEFRLKDIEFRRVNLK